MTVHSPHPAPEPAPAVPFAGSGVEPGAPGPFDAYVRERSGGLKEADLMVAGIHCAACIQTIERGLRSAGAAGAQVNFGTHRAQVTWRDGQATLGTLLDALHRLGYPAHPYDPDTQERARREERRWMLTRLGVAGFGAMNAMLYSVALYAGAAYGMERGIERLFQGITGAIAVPVCLFSGWPFLRGAWGGLRRARINMDGLISFGLLSALLYSWVAFAAFPGSKTYFESVSMGVFVLLIGRALETLARVKSGNVTEALLGLQQRWATRLEGGVERAVPIGQVRPGDRLVVKSGEAFPTDGVLAEGETEADESALTGESRLRFIAAGDAVIGGTLNTGAAALMESRTAGARTVLGRIAQLVETAQQNKAPVQRLADRIAGHFALAVVALAAGAAAGWLWLASGPPPQPVWVIAIAVIIIACPCGLGLATPMAVLVANAAAGRRGILIKGGEALESAARVTDVVLDKTGTLTAGTLAVQRLADADGVPEAGWLELAAALEQRVAHPLAAAVVSAWRQGAGRDAPLASARDVRAHPGRGAEGWVGARHVRVGNERMLAEAGIAVPADVNAKQGALPALFHDSATPPRADGPWNPIGVRGLRPLRGAGQHPAICPSFGVELLPRDTSAASPLAADAAEAQTRIYVAVDGRVAGLIELADPVRADAAETVRGLKALGLRVHVYSGDRAGAVAWAADGLELDDARGGMLPEDKVAAIAALQRAGGTVAMVGDGLNDAPALTRADVGIAVATASDLALQSAQILLMRPALKGVLESLTIARRTFAVIRQNLALSVAYNLLAIPLAIAGLVVPLVAAVSMAASSLLVVANSLRGRLRAG